MKFKTTKLLPEALLDLSQKLAPMKSPTTWYPGCMLHVYKSNMAFHKVEICSMAIIHLHVLELDNNNVCPTRYLD